MKKELEIEELNLLRREVFRLKKKEQYLKIINDFTISLLHEHTIDEILWAIAKSVVAQLNFPDCVVYLVDDKSEFLIQKAAHGPKNPIDLDILNPIPIPFGQGIVGTVAKTRTAEIVADTRLDDRYIEDDAFRFSEITVPIVFNDFVIGVIDSEHPEANFYTVEHLNILRTIAAVSATKIMHAKAAENLLRHQASLEVQIASKTAALSASVANLKRSNQDLESFAFAASHDLKEPLRTISTYLKLLKLEEGSKLSDTGKEFLNFVLDGSARMRLLLDGLLAYSRLKDTPNDHKLVDINEVIIIVRKNLSTVISENNVEFKIGSICQVYGNFTQLLQLFQNLIANAIKFRKKEETPVLSIYSEETEQKIKFFIKDNGIGIKEEFQEKIFGLFNRLNPQDKYDGSGIGLALCKRIVEYHHGKIGVTSKFGEGTTFHFTLPAQPVN